MSDNSPAAVAAPAIATNTLWNVAGAAIPLVVAVFSIPLIIRGLGVDRFGLLTLAWTVIGYFGAFDLGLGVATTKFIAEFRQQGRRSELFSLVFTSALMHLALGIVGACILAGLTSWLMLGVLNVPPALREETHTAFYILAASIPVIVLTACFRGALEGLQRFDLVNIIKIPASIANYVSPLLVLWFTADLGVIVAVIAATRVAVLAAYAFLAFKAVAAPEGKKAIDADVMSELVRFGGWLSISNFVTPIIVSLDRFLIGAFVSASAVAYYATPYEVVTKLWIFSAGLLGVLLPVFSALSVDRTLDVRTVVRQAVRVLLAAVAPVIAIVFLLGGDLLQWWINEDFRLQSTIPACWIAIGMLFSVVAQVPLTALHGAGRTDVTAKIVCLELVVYGLFAWFMVKEIGMNGVAFAWAARAFADALLLFSAADRILPAHESRRFLPSYGILIVIASFLTVALVAGLAITHALILKVIVAGFIVVLMTIWEWRYLLSVDERRSVKNLHGRISKRLAKT